MIEALHTKILALGRFSAREFAAHKQGLIEHLSNPDTLIVERLLVQAWEQSHEQHPAAPGPPQCQFWVQSRWANPAELRTNCACLRVRGCHL